MTLTKRELVFRISDKTGMTQQQSLEIIQKTLDCIVEALGQGQKVELRNFGIFQVRMRKARVGRNPNAPQNTVAVPQRYVVKFKAGQEMRRAVGKLATKTAAGG